MQLEMCWAYNLKHKTSSGQFGIDYYFDVGKVLVVQGHVQAFNRELTAVLSNISVESNTYFFHSSVGACFVSQLNNLSVVITSSVPPTRSWL